MSLRDRLALHELVTDESGNQSVVERHGSPPTPAPRRGEVAWYVPYTAVHPHTVAGAPEDAVWVDVGASEIAYYVALREIWARGETFALLEHDVVCRPGVIAELEECPEPWCTFGYSDICCPGCMEAWANMLGCTRFRKELVDAVPDAMTAIPADNWDWHEMCNGLGANLRAAGFTHHWHFPAVEHHHMGRHE
jgi:hypothetical protein